MWLRKDRTKSKEIIKNHELHSELNIKISLKELSKIIGFTIYFELNNWEKKMGVKQID